MCGSDTAGFDLTEGLGFGELGIEVGGRPGFGDPRIEPENEILKVMFGSPDLDLVTHESNLKMRFLKVVFGYPNSTYGLRNSYSS